MKKITFICDENPRQEIIDPILHNARIAYCEDEIGIWVYKNNVGRNGYLTQRELELSLDMIGAMQKNKQKKENNMSELREVQAYKYYVWRKNGSFPRVTHAFFEQAKQEAERLSRKEKDEVFVLAVVGSYKPAVPPPVWVAADYEEALF